MGRGVDHRVRLGALSLCSLALIVGLAHTVPSLVSQTAPRDLARDYANAPLLVSPSSESSIPASPRTDSDRVAAGGSALPATEPSVAEVELAAGATASDVVRIGLAHGFRVRHALEAIGSVSIESLDGEPLAPSALAALVDDGVAIKARPTVRALPSAIPSDPRYAEQWGFRNTGQAGGTAGADIRAEAAWDHARGDDVVVAVVDEGVMFSHPDLSGQQWVNPGEVPGNGVDDDGNGYTDDVNGWDYVNVDATVYDERDGDLHGTHVAGTVAAATGNGVLGAGTAPGARIMSLKFLGYDGGLYADAEAAIVYAVDNGADVINCSWGGPDITPGLVAAFQYAADRGVLVVSAAGNEGVDLDATPSYPACIETTNNITVAALDRADALAAYSNRGAGAVDIGAPGSDIISTKVRASAAVRVERTAIGGTRPYSLMYFAFPVERLPDTALRDTLITTSVDAIASSESTAVLVVNDSWETLVAGDSDFTGSYTSALSAAGYTNVTIWNTRTQGTPTALKNYDTVIWFTGTMSYPLYYYRLGGSITEMTLSSAERTQVSAYLNAGGNMLLSSGQLADDLEYWFGGMSGQAFFEEYTQCREVHDQHQGTFAGTSGGPFEGVSGSTPLWLAAPYSVGDEVAAYGADATPLLTWTAQGLYLSGTSMATPHVAGALALAWSRTPTATAGELRERLMSTAVPIPSLAGACTTGGRLDADALVGRMAAPAIDSVQAVSPSTASVSWHDFPDAYHDSTRILYRIGARVEGPDDAAATVAYQGALQPVQIPGLTPGAELHIAGYTLNTLGAWSEAGTATVTFDPDPPVTLIATMPVAPDGLAGWYRTAPTVALSSEPGALTFLRWDGDEPVAATSTVAPEGTHTLEYFSVDEAGNREATRTATLRVDSSGPSAPVIDAETVAAGAFRITWDACVDAGSGVAGYRVYDGETLLGETAATTYEVSGLDAGAAHAIGVAALDVAGNETRSAVLSASAHPLTVTAAGGAVQVSFPAVWTDGSTTAVRTGLTAPLPGDLIAVSGTCFDIASSASFTETFTVTIRYDGRDLTPDQEANLRLYHYEHGAWTDITSAADASADTVSGRASSFSPFVIAYDSAWGPMVAHVPASSDVSIALIAALAFWLIERRRQRLAHG